MINKITLLISNLLVLKCFDIKLIKLLYNECTIPIEKAQHCELNSGWIWWNWNSLTKKVFVTKILVSKFTTKQEMFTTICHELGHFIDLKKYGINYNKFNQKQMEKSAWKNAILLANKYGIDLNYSTAVNSLSTYSARYKRLENLVK